MINIIIMRTQKYLLVSLQQIQLRGKSNNNPQSAYLGFSLNHPHSYRAHYNKIDHQTSKQEYSQKYLSADFTAIINEHNQNVNNIGEPGVSNDYVTFVELNDDIIITLPAQSSVDNSILYLSRYQNCILQYVFAVADLSAQLNAWSSESSKKLIKKKQQTKNNQIVTYQLSLLTQGEQFLMKPKYNDKILQHYVFISNITVGDKQQPVRRATKRDQLKYYTINSATTDLTNKKYQESKKFILAQQDRLQKWGLSNYIICLKIPSSISIKSYRSPHQLQCKSQKYKIQESSIFIANNKNQTQIQLSGQKNTLLKCNIQWGINLHETDATKALLADAHQILIYDIQVKFQNYNEHANSKVKIIYANKAFQLNGHNAEFNVPKPAKIRKFIHFMIKSEDEEIVVAVEKNLKIVAQSRFYTDQLISYSLNYPKRKLIDVNSHKVIGHIKFKCQKAKNLSLPQSNKFWKENNKKKLQPNIITLAISQISAHYVHDQPLQVVFKTDAIEKVVSEVPNFLYFDSEIEITTQSLTLNVKSDESVYLLVRPKSQEGDNGNSSNDFIGISLLNFNQLLIGENPIQIPFFKNQTKTVSINCLINKVIGYPFIKSTFQPQLLISAQLKTICVTLFLKKISLTPYFYTFTYTNKSQIYSIIEINRQKKVLILEPAHQNDLLLEVVSSSDNLNFIIEDCEYIRIKITILVTDLGQNQQIYGTAVVKAKVNDFINQQPKTSNDNKLVNFNKLPLKNQYSFQVGKISLEVYEGVMENSHRKSTRDILETARPKIHKDIKSIKEKLTDINHNISQIEVPNQDDYQAQYFSNTNESSKIKNNHQSLEINKHSTSLTTRKKKNSVSIQLPQIKQTVKGPRKKKDNFDEFMKLMQVRKRGPKGYYEDKSSLGVSSNVREPLNSMHVKKPSHRYHTNSHPTNQNKSVGLVAKNDSQLQKIQRQNPNLDRNLEIIFPKKIQRHEQIKKQIHEYEEKLLGLKSVLKEISHDIGEIQPTINGDSPPAQKYHNGRESPFENKSKSKQKISPDNIQWQDNQFAMYQ